MHRRGRDPHSEHLTSLSPEEVEVGRDEQRGWAGGDAVAKGGK